MAALWQAQWRRPPTRDELTRLVGDRVREEVLYREALDLDENDVLVRRRLAEKLEMALNDVAATAEPSADDLRRHFESHADRYVDDWRRDHVAARESERYAEMRARYEVDVAPFASIGDLVQP